jgi:hypothetical protein
MKREEVAMKRDHTIHPPSNRELPCIRHRYMLRLSLALTNALIALFTDAQRFYAQSTAAPLLPRPLDLALRGGEQH